MRKPISKHALRRAMERVQEEGFLRWDEPTGTVVDRIWHELEKERFQQSPRKKGASRETIREGAEAAPAGVAAEPGVGEA
jgi:DNA-binding GntR family transcriptional regulator